MKKYYWMMLVAALLLFTTDATAQRRRAQRQTEQRDTVTVLKEQASAGNAAAQNTLGNWYYKGQNVQQNYEVALKYWALSAQQGNAEAIGNMAMCYQLGRGTNKDSAMAVKLYKEAFKKGNTTVLQQHVDLADKKNNLFSAVLLHEVYRDGIGVTRDSRKAQQYLQKAAEGGDTECQKDWAMLQLNAKNTTESAKWFKKLADKGNLTGIYYYGYQLFKGMGVQQDKERAISYLQRAANSGMLAGNRMLGAAYYEGEGVAKDYKAAVENLKKAVTGKYPDSQILLAKCYINGNGVTQNYDQAMQWLSEAFCQNSNQAEEVKKIIDDETDENFRTFIEGLEDLYVDQDYADAMKLFKKVEKAKIVEGATMQGVCLMDEQNPKGDAKKAFKILEKAAETSAAAKYYLAQLYQEGKGVEKDTKKAGELILKAANEDNGYAQEKAGDMYFEGRGVAQDYVKAVEYYLMAEAQSKLTPASARNLAKCYSMGINNLPDKNKAQERIEALNKVRSTNKLLDMLKKL